MRAPPLGPRAHAALLAAATLAHPSLAFAHGARGVGLMVATFPTPLALVVLVAQLVARRRLRAPRRLRAVGATTLVFAALIGLWQGLFAWREFATSGFVSLAAESPAFVAAALLCFAPTAACVYAGIAMTRTPDGR